MQAEARAGPTVATVDRGGAASTDGAMTSPPAGESPGRVDVGDRPGGGRRRLHPGAASWPSSPRPGSPPSGRRSAEQALAFHTDHGPALVVIDYLLPDRNGLELAQALKEREPNPARAPAHRPCLARDRHRRGGPGRRLPLEAHGHRDVRRGRPAGTGPRGPWWPRTATSPPAWSGSARTRPSTTPSRGFRDLGPCSTTGSTRPWPPAAATTRLWPSSSSTSTASRP